eukprot:9496241-Lingulodinium_polyedra.AAC.1
MQTTRSSTPRGGRPRRWGGDPEGGDLRPIGLPLALPLQLAHRQVPHRVPAPAVRVPHADS